jgi:anti-anti-sigma regulatory factor
MDIQSKLNFVCDTPKAGIRVVRFVRSDLRPQLDEKEDITDCLLFRELDATALADLPAGETVVINFGLIEWFPTAFYRLLLKVGKAVQARNARLMLCCFTPIVQEGFDLMGGGKVFEVRATEVNAVFEVGKEYAEARRKPG